MMKIFLVHEDIYNAGNPYIYTLKDGVEQNHPDVEFGWGRDEFWSETIFTYDIVHFQWPAAFMNGDRAHTIDDFCKHMKNIRSRGVTIVSTCHDLKPHYGQCSDFGEAIRITYEMSDVILHMGEYSRRLFMKEYPQSKHLILSHHLYDRVYTHCPTRDEALKKLGLATNKKYVLCMGMFRADEERELVLQVAKKLRGTNVEIIAPAYINARYHLKRKFPYIPIKGIKAYIYYTLLYKIHFTGQTWVPVSDADLPYYYVACDVALVQRKKILNSGNAVMPLLFGMPVVGPNTGNVGEFLKEFGGYTFDVDKLDEIPTIVKMALSQRGPGESIKQHAMERLSTDVISSQLYEIYRGIKNKNE